MFHQDRITHLRLCGSELYADNYVCMLRDWTVVDFTVDVPQRFKLLTNHVRVAVDDCSVTLHQYHVNFASRDVDKRFVRCMYTPTHGHPLVSPITFILIHLHFNGHHVVHLINSPHPYWLISEENVSPFTMNVETFS